MSTLPVKIAVIERKTLQLIWQDGTVSDYPLGMLRSVCPCAVCAEERVQQSQHYIPLFHHDQVTIESIKPVGSYAINIQWKDGHNTGIYEYQFLQKLQGKTVNK